MVAGSMLGRVPALDLWTWQLVDERVAGEEQVELPALSDGERAVAGELRPVVEATCDLREDGSSVDGGDRPKR